MRLLSTWADDAFEDDGEGGRSGKSNVLSIACRSTLCELDLRTGNLGSDWSLGNSSLLSTACRSPLCELDLRTGNLGRDSSEISRSNWGRNAGVVTLSSLNHRELRRRSRRFKLFLFCLAVCFALSSVMHSWQGDSAPDSCSSCWRKDSMADAFILALPIVVSDVVWGLFKVEFMIVCNVSSYLVDPWKNIILWALQFSSTVLLYSWTKSGTRKHQVHLQNERTSTPRKEKKKFWSFCRKRKISTVLVQALVQLLVLYMRELKKTELLSHFLLSIDDHTVVKFHTRALEYSISSVPN
jgi:hypothetical protein